MRRLLSPGPMIAAAAVAGLLALLAYGVLASEPDRGIDAALAAGDRPPAPPLTLPTLEGRGERSLADYRGRVVLLNWWASWCDPCREESPLLQRWHERIEPRGGTVLGIDTLDVTSDANDFIREYGLTYPMLRDAEGETQEAYGVAAYPETAVIDREGRVTALRRGPVDEAFLEAEVEPLLAEGGSG